MSGFVDLKKLSVSEQQFGNDLAKLAQIVMYAYNQDFEVTLFHENSEPEKMETSVRNMTDASALYVEVVRCYLRGSNVINKALGKKEDF